MTWGQDKRDGGDSSIATATQAYGRDPGKSTRTQSAPAYTGNRYADNGASCEADPSQLECYLPDKVRDRVIAELGGRITSLEGMVQRAIEHQRMVRMMTPQATINPIVGILLDAFSAGFATSIVSKFGSWRTSAITNIGKLEADRAIRQASGIVEKAGWQEGVRGYVAGIQPADVGSKVATVIGKAKAAVSSAPSSAPATIDSFLQGLSKTLAIGFQEMREQTPADVTDPMLVILWESFDARHHDPGVYEAQIEAMCDRYLASGVADIGRAGGEGHDMISGWREPDPLAGKDVRIAYARFVSGFPMKLFYQHTGSTLSPSLREELPMKFGSPDREKGKDVVPKPGISSRESGHFWVPDEFKEAAVQRQIAVWGSLPPIVDIDDSQWYWDPPRAEAARRKKEANTPRLGLATSTVTHPAEIEHVPLIDELVREGLQNADGPQNAD